MRRILPVLVLVLFGHTLVLSSQSLAQEWKFRERLKGTLTIVDLYDAGASAVMNYAEGLVELDKDHNYAAGLAEDWRWIDDRTIEFKLREGVRFHNGEKFNAEAVKVNWEEYRRMEDPRPISLTMLPDETILKIIDDYTVRFTLPEPDGLALPKFLMFYQIAPAFFSEHKFDERLWGYLREAGPWGTGAFKLVEGGVPFGKASDRVVLEAYEGYWDRRYPKLQRVIFDNSLIGNREEAMRLCTESEGAVDVVIFIRPLDTLKVAESPYAKVQKSRDVTALYGAINQRRKDSKWREIRLREALNYGVNREELWKYCAKGNAFNLGGFIPPGAYGHNPDLTFYSYDTTKARSLLAEAGYAEGFVMKIITPEAWKLEAQIISKILERIEVRVILDVFTMPEFLRRTYVPYLEKFPEEQDWDIAISHLHDCYGHVGTTFLLWPFYEEGENRWIENNPAYNEMWKDMAKTLDSVAQEKKVKQLAQYVADHAYCLFIYTPLTLYAVNKEVNFVPWKRTHLRLKETSVTDNHWSVREENQ